MQHLDIVRGGWRGADALRLWRVLLAVFLLLIGGLLGEAPPAGAVGSVVAAPPAQAGASALVSGVLPILTSPLLAGLLFALGILLIVAEFLTAQFTGLGLAGVSLLALVFWGHHLAGRAGWASVALVALGLALLALEAFVIPGFGLAGVAGLAALLGGLFLAVAGEETARADLGRGLSAVGVALLGFIAGGALLLRALPRLANRRGLVLQATVGGLGQALALVDDPADLATSAPLVGSVGEVSSDLRPGGFALIDGVRLDVITRGEFIERGARVQVVADEGYRRVVRRLGPDERPAEI